MTFFSSIDLESCHICGPKANVKEWLVRRCLFEEAGLTCHRHSIMAEPVYVIGAGRTDFKRNFKKEGKTIRHIILEAARDALAGAGIDPADIQAGVVGNFASGLFTRQLHLGALLTELDEKLRGIPTVHVEAACASGGVAVLSAAQQI